MPASTSVSVDGFLDRVGDSLYSLPGVEAVALGGSRARGTNRPDSDWDLAVYYRGQFDPDSIRALGWPGQISDIGGWGPVFNGGGALTVDGRLIDVHYRDLDVIERVHDDALRGEFTITNLLFHQCDLPSYILLAELSINQTLRGQLPAWDYPAALREASSEWWHRASATLRYARSHARAGRVAQCAGLLSEAACHTGHAILAHRGEWITNEKQLLTNAGLRDVDHIIAHLGTEPDRLLHAVKDTDALLTAAAENEGL
jgi:predicted nucleotidyltransferase